jgi:hypothetical protein
MVLWAEVLWLSQLSISMFDASRAVSACKDYSVESLYFVDKSPAFIDLYFFLKNLRQYCSFLTVHNSCDIKYHYRNERLAIRLYLFQPKVQQMYVLSKSFTN